MYGLPNLARRVCWVLVGGHIAAGACDAKQDIAFEAKLYHCAQKRLFSKADKLAPGQYADKVEAGAARRKHFEEDETAKVLAHILIRPWVGIKLHQGLAVT